MLVVLSAVTLIADYAFAAIPIYPRGFYLTGMIDLSYRDFSSEASTDGRHTIKRETTRFEQRYKLNLSGHIWKPKFALFNAGVTFKHSKIETDTASTNQKNIGYDLNIRFFPYRATTLQVYAAKYDYTTSGETQLSSFDASSRIWGGNLVFARSRNFAVILSYQNWVYSSERFILRPKAPDEDDFFFDDFDGPGLAIIEQKKVPEKIESTRYGITLKGNIKALRSKYTLRYERLNYTNPVNKFTADSLNANINTLIKKDISLITYSSYSDNSISKTFNLNTSMRLNTSRNLTQTYSYEFFQADYNNTKAETSYSNALRAAITYRITSRLLARGDLYYRITKRDGTTNDMGSAGLDYMRPIKNIFNFRSFYRFTMQKSDDTGKDLSEHRFGLRLSTRTLRWAEMYTSYDLNIRDYKRSNSIEHLFIAGMEGRGPGRLVWLMEGKYAILETSGMETAGQAFAGDLFDRQTLADTNAGDYSYYSFTGKISYPFKIRMRVSFSGTYTGGQVGSRALQRVSFDGRISYRIISNMYLVASWLEGHESLEGRPDQTTRIQDIKINYRIRGTFLDLEYRIMNKDNGFSTQESRNLYIKLRRPI